MTAWVARFEVAPTGSGPLDGLTFGVKDLIDVQGQVTGCGNPSWRDAQSPRAHHAVCVDQLLAAGARLVGKTITDELAFGLTGENYFYGTPLNPKAPERVPGGSSSGSASAVAQAECDFALGTDTTGSIRVPASNCGLFGLRPTHDRISLAGVNPLAPTFDTVGLLSARLDTLTRVARVLVPGGAVPVARLLVVEEALALCDPGLTWPGERVRLADLVGEPVDLRAWGQTQSHAQWSEIGSTLGTWVATGPELGPATQMNFALVGGLDRSRIQAVLERRERIAAWMADGLPPGTVLCFPTTPRPAPLKGSLGLDRSKETYYGRVLGLTSVAGLARLPQLSLPLLEAEGAPVGLSLLAAAGQDHTLLACAAELCR